MCPLFEGNTALAHSRGDGAPQVCWDGGHLVCCSECPAAYHPECLGVSLQASPGPEAVLVRDPVCVQSHLPCCCWEGGSLGERRRAQV